MSRVEQVRQKIYDNEMNGHHPLYELHQCYEKRIYPLLAPITGGRSKLFSKKNLHKMDLTIPIDDTCRSVIAITVNDDVETFKYLMIAYHDDMIAEFGYWLLSRVAISGNFELIHLTEQLDYEFSSKQFHIVLNYMGKIITAYNLTHDKFYIKYFNADLAICNYLINHYVDENINIKQWEYVDESNILDCYREYIKATPSMKIRFPTEICIERFPALTEMDQIDLLYRYRQDYDGFKEIISKCNIDKNILINLIRNLDYVGYDWKYVKVIIEHYDLPYDDVRPIMLKSKSILKYFIERYNLKFTRDEVIELCNEILHTHGCRVSILKRFMVDYDIKLSDECMQYFLKYPNHVLNRAKLAAIWKLQFKDINEFKEWLGPKRWQFMQDYCDSTCFS